MSETTTGVQRRKAALSLAGVRVGVSVAEDGALVIRVSSVKPAPDGAPLRSRDGELVPCRVMVSGPDGSVVQTFRMNLHPAPGNSPPQRAPERVKRDTGLSVS